MHEDFKNVKFQEFQLYLIYLKQKKIISLPY